ncbi:helix-turn-helix domain-containing protein [Sulfurovum sp. CS9]|uniref:helix-turn-helix domain-containing protein n=1 Tax=Sulfurovum sp. CS9 TaxID=3391146 RepID=UPI0039ECDC13
MQTKKHIPPPLILNEGYFVDHYYDGHEEMHSHTENWDLHCTYQLLPNALKGHHQILQLHSMQLSCVQRPGGMMDNSSSAKDCLTFAVLEESTDKACFDHMKIQAGDIVFFDDSRPLNFLTNDAFKLCAVTMQKEKMGTLLPKVSQALYHTIKDTDDVMSKALNTIWEEFTEQGECKKDKETFRDAEEKINSILMKLLEEQTPTPPKLTKGEEKALDIRDQVYHHMDRKINIESLSKQHHISERTLQNSFKSLFGFTPNYFLRQLKLNLVHNELKKSDPAQSTVSRIAQKWGFTHMGRFSSFYTELFGENPSKTLKRDYQGNPAIAKSCASRQEEMD